MTTRPSTPHDHDDIDDYYDNDKDDHKDDHDDNQAPHSPPSDDLEPPAGLSFSALGQAPGEGLGYQVCFLIIIVITI